MSANRSAEASRQLPTVCSEVFRGVSFFSAHLSPPAPIVSGGSGSRMCLTTRPPHIAQGGGVRVVRHIRLVGGFRGCRRAPLWCCGLAGGDCRGGVR